MRFHRKLTTLAVLAAILLLVGQGCRATRGQISSDRDARSEVAKAALAHMQSYIDGDAEDFLSGYSDEFVDLGGGAKGDGSLDLLRLRAKLDREFASESFKREFGNAVLADVLLVDCMEIYSYEEIVKDERLRFDRFGYTLQPGDYLVVISPTASSPLHDGFVAYYRKTEGKWLVAAAD